MLVSWGRNYNVDVSHYNSNLNNFLQEEISIITSLYNDQNTVD